MLLAGLDGIRLNLASADSVFSVCIISSVQGGNYALGKAHVRSTPSLRRFPNVATVKKKKKKKRFFNASVHQSRSPVYSRDHQSSAYIIGITA